MGLAPASVPPQRAEYVLNSNQSSEDSSVQQILQVLVLVLSLSFLLMSDPHVQDINESQMLEELSVQKTADTQASPTSIPAQEVVDQGITNLEVIAEVISSINKTIVRLQADFDAKIKYDDSKERTIDALHRELQHYREDLSFKILRPLIIDLVGLHDDLVLNSAKYSKLEQVISPDQITNEFISFASDVGEILNRYGFELYRTDSDIFDRSLQKAQKVINTDNAQLDKHISERLRKGIRYGNRIIRPEAVTAYRYVASSTPVLENSSE